MNEFDQEEFDLGGGLKRRPSIYLEVGVGRGEMLGMGAVAGLILVCGWTIVNLITSGLDLALPLTMRLALGVPGGLFLLPVAVGLFFPRPQVETSRLRQYFLGAKIRGSLRRIDLVILLLGLAGLLLVGARTVLARLDLYEPLPVGLSIPLTVLGIALAVTTVGMMALPSLPFLSRGRSAALPSWIKGRQALEQIEAPEEGASFSYPFPSERAPEGDVGVLVPPQLLARLREINAEADGQLFRQDQFRKAAAVVLGVDPPVDDLGVDELQRLARQLAWYSHEAGWTRYQLAGRILEFVQRNITYEEDDVSTERILGTPYREYGRFPLETLEDQVGDCECTAILCASLLGYLGFRSALLRVTIDEGPLTGPSYHVAVGLCVSDRDLLPLIDDASQDDLSLLIHEGRSYLYGETATDNDDPDGFGVLPYSWKDRMKIEVAAEIPAFEP